ncbi:MAG: Gfo/Idh/MocA family protein [Phycisphaerae bacterium]
MPENLRIGVMGCGVVANYGHLPAINYIDGVTCQAVFDPLIESAQREQRAYNIPVATDDVNVFFEAGLDAVLITSPAPTHLENVLMCAERKLPVLCEKPLAMTEEESWKIIHAMEAAKTPIYVGFTYRFGHPASEIKRQLEKGVIGKPMSLRLIYLWDCHGRHHPRDDRSKLNMRRHDRFIEGGPMVDCGVHQIDLARWWLGSEVADYTGHGVWVEDHEAPDHMYLHMNHETGCHTMVEMGYSYAATTRDERSHFLYEIIGTDGLIRYDRQARQFDVVHRTGTQNLTWDYEKNFNGLHEAFRDAIRTGNPGHCPTAKDGLLATKIARDATERVISARSSK